LPLAAFTIEHAESTADLVAVRDLFLEYVEWLGIRLDFQDFDAELASLPGKYAPPQGRLLLARQEGGYVGVVALRPLDPGICEMKRLYVRPASRGRRLGEALVDRVIAEATAIGYCIMRLDTFPHKMPSAVALYHSRGFVPIAAYCVNPVPEVAYMERVLRQGPRD